MPEKNSTTKKIRTVFMGTPEFACPGLTALLAAPEFEIVGVFTQTDKPVGRKQILTPPPVKELALKYGISVYQPVKIKTEAEKIRNLKPDIIIVIAYGKIIPPEILAIPTYGCINVHASLLPKYRGAACLNAPILNGDNETGVTIMKMDAGLDTGPILRQARIKLNGQETLADVHDKLSDLGAKYLIPTVTAFIQGEIQPQAQSEENVSYIKTLKREDGKINWSLSADEIERLIRAYNPWPGSYTTVETDDKILKIIAVNHEVIQTNNHKIGEIFLIDNKPTIQCGQDALVILKLQLSGGRATTAEEFFRGHGDLIGKILK